MLYVFIKYGKKGNLHYQYWSNSNLGLSYVCGLFIDHGLSLKTLMYQIINTLKMKW